MDNYSYLKFALMPNQFINPVSPFTPYTTRKVVLKYTFDNTTLSLAANGFLEGVVAQPIASGSTSTFVSLFYSASPATSTTLTGKYGTAKGLSTSFVNNSVARYIGGYLKITSSDPGVVCEARTYTGTSSNTNASSWDTLSTTAFPITSKNIDTDGVILSSIPSHLNMLNLSKADSAMYPPTRIHFRIVNNSATTVSYTMSGNWWVESYTGSGTSLAYDQDTKCPKTLAEHILGQLRDQYFCFSVSQNLITGLDSVIDTTLANLLNTWRAFNDILATGPIDPPDPEPEIDTDEEWGNRPKVWKP